MLFLIHQCEWIFTSKPKQVVIKVIKAGSELCEINGVLTLDIYIWTGKLEWRGNISSVEAVFLHVTRLGYCQTFNASLSKFSGKKC